MPRGLVLLLLFAITVRAHAVVVRGRVTTAFGVPLPGSRVQLIALSGGPRNVAGTISGMDGGYEIRIDLAGRFLLITSPSVNAPLFAPQIGDPFYGSRTGLRSVDVALNRSSITPQTTRETTLVNTPLLQLATLPTQLAADHLLTEATPLPALARTPGAFLVQYGQIVAPATLYLRGAPLSRVEIDGASGESLVQALLPFNFGTLTTSGLAASSGAPVVELSPGPNPLHLLNAGAGVFSTHTPVANTLTPVLTLVGDAGNLSNTRAEAIASLARSRTDILASFARFNTDNDLPAAPAHLITYAANIGYAFLPSTTLRLSARDDASAAPLSIPFAFYGLQPSGKQSAQNLYSSVTFETRTAGNWHNLVRYGLVRERNQIFNFATPATGVPVTITGANGYTASGTATFPVLPAREEFVTYRDEATYGTNFPLLHSETHPLTGVLTARYQNERAADLTAASRKILERTHVSVAAGLQGSLRHRFFYEASGLLDHSADLGLLGNPRLGVTWVPFRPGSHRLRDTTLRASAGTAVQDPTLSAQFSITTPQIPHTRTLDIGVEQAILVRKATVRATYFHTQNSNQPELLALPQVISDTAAYRTQGLETAATYQPVRSVSLQGGYTFLASLVEKSAAPPTTNPNLINTAIGALTALPGARPFHRPPHSGFFAVVFTGSAVSATLKATFAGRSDDSTFLVQTPTLLLPNRNLTPGYIDLDASVTYFVTHFITTYLEMTNLFDNRHIAPLGYLSTPFQLSAGVLLRLGRE